MGIDIEHLRTWIGHTESMEDTVTRVPLQALAAVLDCSPEPSDDRVPPGWHWLYFLPIALQAELGADGHPQRGGFLPPVPLARRMWAGNQVDFLAPLRIGQSLRRVSRIADVRLKEGRTGPLVFVRVEHEIFADGTRALVEQHEIVYRDLPQAGEPVPAYISAPETAPWCRQIVPDAVLLFRYSAVTFNGHRIHYDRSYATQVEGYPGLVVHGPLIATLLLDLLRRKRPDARVRRFRFRALKPLFDVAPFDVCARMENDTAVELWSRDATGHITMQAQVTLA